MPALITSLIDKQDNVEVVRDQIAAILLTEKAQQMALAETAGKDPRLWDLRVFVERSNPWDAFQEAEPDQLKNPPIVNVTFETSTTDMAASNIVERQKVVATYNIDCYGYGVAKSDVNGHIAGDQEAAIQSQRATRLVRNILMASEYMVLQMRGTVWRRWPQSITAFMPEFDGRSLQQVVANRISFQVEFNEFSPQVDGAILEIVAVTVKRAETGEVFFIAQYGETTP